MIKRALCWPVAALLLAGCQSYQPKPLDLPEYGKSLRERDPAAGEVVAYARQLAGMGQDGVGPYDPSDGLSLPEAEVVALFFNPQLRQARLKAKVPQVGAKEAGRWEDPELAVDGARIVDSVDEPWVLGGMLSFTIPLSGRLGAEKRLAMAEADAEVLRAYLREMEVLAELRARWMEWSAAEQRIELTRKYLADLNEMVARAEKLRDAGELDALDARLFRIERTSVQGQLRVLELEQREAEITLKSLMGLAATADVQLRPTLTPPGRRMPATQPAEAMVADHPRLRLARAEYQVAERTLAAEIRKQYPDLTIGAGPGTEEGDSRVLFGGSLPLPLLNANKRGIAEARAAREAAGAAAEAEYEQLVAELAKARLIQETARIRLQLLRDELVPLVDQQVAEARKLARLGEFETLVSLEAYTKAFETKLDVLEAMLKQSLAESQIQTLLGAGHVPSPVVESKP